MNKNLNLKTQNIRSLNLSTTTMKRKINALCHEKNHLIFATNCQIGSKENIVKNEFYRTENGPYHIICNSKSQTLAGVLIAIHNDLNCKIIDRKKDTFTDSLFLKSL